MCDYDLDPCDVWVETERVCRKQAVCSCCRRTIRKGEPYLRHFSIYDGDLHNGRLCADCRGFRGEFADAHHSLLCQPSYFPEMLRNCIADGDDESDAKWKPMLTAIEAASASAKSPSAASSS